MRVVVTGGSGAVGRRLVGTLRHTGTDVVVLGRKADPRGSVTVTDYSVTDLAAHLDGADTVVHLAWRRTPSDRLDAFFPSISATESLIAAAIAGGVSRAVFASSISVYTGRPPWTEATRPVPATAYGHSKLIGEELFERAAQRGLSSVSLRIGHVYTDDEDNDYAVNKFIRAAEAGTPISVSGDSLRTRDMVYVEDVCTAISLAITSDTTGPINVGSGSPVSMGDVARAAVASFNDQSVIDDQESPSDGSGSTLMDVNHAASALGYTPRFSIQAGMTDIAKRRSARP